MQKMKYTVLKVLVGAALGLTAHAAFADSYAHSSDTSVVKNNFGDCWRTGYWKEGDAIPDCGGAAPKKEEAPKPVSPTVEAPKPTPTPAPAPKPAAPKKLETISLNASSLFEFNKAVLTKEGRQSLDSVVAILNERGYVADKSKIEVVGHTDRIGSAKYNQSLSEARAAAAREYIVSKGVDTKLISSAGKGFSQPVTKPEDCKKVLKNRAKLIKCYAPDRRVDVDIYATRDAI